MMRLDLRSKVRGALSAWFSSGVSDWRSPDDLIREKYVFYFLPPQYRCHYKRWMCIFPAVITQMVLGSFYSTSVFNKINDTKTWKEPGTNARMFIACVACYGMGTLIFGNWVGRNGVNASVSRALILTPLGWAAAGAAISFKIEALLYVYGLLHGVGCAMCYISTTSALAAWYPESKGFMAGVAVFGAGLGATVWTLVARALMDPNGYAFPPERVLFTFSAIFFLLLAVSLPFLRNPPPPPELLPLPDTLTPSSSPVNDPKHTNIKTSSLSCSKKSAPATTSATPDRVYTFVEAFTSYEFLLTAIIVFTTSLPGVVFLSSAADMASNLFGLDTQAAALITSYLNLVNFLGRFLWGAVTDVIGRKSFYLLSAALQCISLIIMRGAVRSGSFSAWLTSFLFIGSLYGGGFGVLPAFVAELWGSKISSSTHGAAISTWAFACIVGALVFTLINSMYAVISLDGHKVPSLEGYAVNATWLAVLPALGFIAIIALNVRREDRIVARVTKSFRVRLGNFWVLSLETSGCRWPRLLNQTAQREEYKLYLDIEGDHNTNNTTNATGSTITTTHESNAVSDGLAEWGIHHAPTPRSDLT